MIALLVLIFHPAIHALLWLGYPHAALRLADVSQDAQAWVRRL